MAIDLNFQREGAVSNAHVGRDFETLAQDILFSQGLKVFPNYPIELGVTNTKKRHAFDLGCSKQKIIVECKSHRWTSGDVVPSAKLTVWNEAMYYFYLAPSEYRKIMFVLNDVSKKRGISLADYYQQKFNHLIPEDVEFWEFCEVDKTLRITEPKEKI